MELWGDVRGQGGVPLLGRRCPGGRVEVLLLTHSEAMPGVLGTRCRGAPSGAAWLGSSPGVSHPQSLVSPTPHMDTRLWS